MTQPDEHSRDDRDPWAWAHRPHNPPATPHGADAVLGVLIAHNGADWLPRTLVALAGLRTRPGRLIALDAASDDDSARLLARAVHEGILDAAYSGPGDVGFGASVRRALDLDAPSQGGGNAPQWLWLLHDDLEPEHGALDNLLRAANPPEGMPAPDVLVPKLLHPRLRNHADQMSALGESIAPNGARVPSVESGDIDQHQLDAGPVLGGSTAGMFIRLAAWRQLGGLDPAIPLYRDGVDFGWRALEAGLVVRSCPQAAFRHREAGRVGLRDSQVAPNAQIADAVAGMRVASAHSPHPGRTSRAITASSWGTALAYVIGKSPGRAADQLRALRQFRASRDETQRLADRVGPASAHAVLPAGVLPDRAWNVRHAADTLAGRMGDAVYELRNDEGGSGLDELTGSDYANVAVTRRVLSARLLTVLIAVVTSLLAVRGLFGSDPLVAARLLPAPGELSQAWAAWGVPLPGAHGANAPWLGLEALGSTLALGKPDLFIFVWLACSVGLATWVSSHLFAKVCGRGWFANGLALAWGLALPVCGAISQGSIDLVALAVLLPGLGTALLRWRQRPITGAEGWRAPGAVALWTGLIAMFFPALALASLVLAGGLAHARHDRRGALVALGGPFVIVAPWLIRLVTTPGRVLTGIDPSAAVAADAASPLALLFGRGLGANTPWWVSLAFLGLVGAGAVIGYLRAPADELDATTRRVIALAGAGALVMACALPHLVVTLGDSPVRPTGVEWYLAAVFVALALTGFGIGRPVPVHGERAQDRPLDRLLTRAQIAQGLLIAASVLIGSVWWVAGGATGSLHRAGSPVPSYVDAVENSPRDTRTLMVQIDAQGNQGTVRYALSDARSPHWGGGESDAISPDPRLREQVSSLARQIARGAPSDDMAARLAQLGVAHVWVRGASPEARSSLADTPGMTAAVADQDTTVWTLNEPVARSVVRADGKETPAAGVVPPGDGDRLLVVAEPASGRWHATVDGHQLRRADSGDWRQSFALGSASGPVSWHAATGWAGCAWQVIALVLAMVLAAPAATNRTNAPRRALASRAPARPARRIADPEGFTIPDAGPDQAPRPARRRAAES
ncbi:glycosyltransferase family 2 protein [Propionibacterium freudenreichii]|uniref:glycosyltransferase family 2 protein n=1 Tax=Propionibacterium freudenreichii TaxID=1744 RepID=UPI00254ED430|nr:hypothetical protein [Propionibacterium freudenreichii]MDK9669097.1 glycosyltransferase family 2 protein [Propionibacterium freudenreichii]